jgi:RNA polymerase sigma-70 factor (ECF subfamily)
VTVHAHLVAERAAREHYSRLLAVLAAQFRDVSAAEDALSESLVAALTQWPRSGVPDNPAAWLLTVARRRLADAHRRRETARTALERTAWEQPSGTQKTGMNDQRLQLLLACAHPAIDESVRAPLMLQVVFGLDAATVATTFLTSATAMAQRLVRAKQKIRDARIPFRIPDWEEFPARLACVLTAIYALFAHDGFAPQGGKDQLAQEAIWLGHLVVALSNRDPEALGLLALMLYVESRREARRDREGRYVPLSRQSTARWDRGLIARAETLLHEAAAKDTPARFQLEAAIQSAHASRMHTGTTDWPAILRLYDGLIALAPTLVVATNRSLAVLQVGGPQDALAALDCISSDRPLDDYQPYWAARAHILMQCDRQSEAGTCYARAIELQNDPAAAEFLRCEMVRTQRNF